MALQSLLDTLKDEDSGIRRQAAEAHGLFCDKPSIDVLKRLEKTETDSDVGKAIKKALRKLKT